MPRVPPPLRTARSRSRPAPGLLAQRTRALAARAGRPGTPGLIAPGPGFPIPQLRPEHYAFTRRRCSLEAAHFAANLLRADVAHPDDWAATRNIAFFLTRTLHRFVGDRRVGIDRAFSLALNLSPLGEGRLDESDLRPERVFLSFRVIDRVTWVNLRPALEWLEGEHEFLPSFFYHALHRAVSREFRVFAVEDARWRWDDWVELREGDEEPADDLRPEPKLPDCVQPTLPVLTCPASSLARTGKAKRLMMAVERLLEVAQRPQPLALDAYSQEDREDLFSDADPDPPLLTLAFGEHDAITELLNEELETAGQVDLEPHPIFKMDGTNPVSIQSAFACADQALDTLAAAARVLLLTPGFEPMP